jgi:monofunctional biosynthetic peptidoglycan transglycosylase
MSIDEIDREMARAVIAGEDSKFCSHYGLRPGSDRGGVPAQHGGRQCAARRIDDQPADREERLPVAGRRLFPQRAGGVVHLLIETFWSKRRIMEVYLNVAETGIGTYGANAGAQRYFQARTRRG